MTSVDKLQFTTAEIHALMSNDATTYYVIRKVLYVNLSYIQVKAVM